MTFYWLIREATIGGLVLMLTLFGCTSLYVLDSLSTNIWQSDSLGLKKSNMKINDQDLLKNSIIVVLLKNGNVFNDTFA